MTFARLVIRDLFRNRLRLVLTVLSGAVAVLAFVFLQTAIRMFYLGAEAAQADRLIVRNKTSFTQPLPLAYLQRIAAVPGVELITHQSWFGGTLGDSPRDQFPNFYVDSNTFFSVFTDLTVPAEQLAAFKADPCGAAVGEDLAAQRRWKVGDRVVLKGSFLPGDWPVTIRAIYGSTVPGGDTSTLFLGYRCVNERVQESMKNRTGIFALRIDDPGRSAQVAATIDAMFANSPYETRTESERAFALGFIAMSSAIVVAIRTISYVVLAILLLVVSNTLVMGVREKTVELATLKALGFRSRQLVSLVLWQAAAVGLASCVVGLLAAPPVIGAFIAAVRAQFGPVPELRIGAGTVVLSVVAVLIVCLGAATFPAVRVGRLIVSEGLRRGGA